MRSRISHLALTTPRRADLGVETSAYAHGRLGSMLFFMKFKANSAAASKPLPRSANRPAAYAAQSPSGRSSTLSPGSRSSAGQISVPVSSRSSGTMSSGGPRT